ncbi:hypothetical protein LCGC14_1076810 [marine sediment metagenome]|uniref:Uncharacterized protein n=1 Tax=marine sediment metagenome TaxID=412755 RepID=A0A0F9MLC0_9ZZZZ
MKLEINQNNGKNFTVLKVSLKIPEKLKPVIESIGKITGREVDDLSSLLIIDQILRYLKDYDTFSKNLVEGVD